jgi:hypothetical protein
MTSSRHFKLFDRHFHGVDLGTRGQDVGGGGGHLVGLPSSHLSPVFSIFVTTNLSWDLAAGLSYAANLAIVEILQSQLHSHHVSLVQWITCLLPVTRDPGSNTLGVLM